MKKSLTALILSLCTVMLTSCVSQGVNVVVADKNEDQHYEQAEDPQQAQTENEGRLVDIILEGGSGKATVDSPVRVTRKDGRTYVTLVWSSPNYDYVIVEGEKYLNENPSGMSTFTVPVLSLYEPFTFIADTTSMSKPHEIEYTIYWNRRDGEDSEDDTESDIVDGSVDASEGFGIRPSDRQDILIDGKKPDGKLDLKYANGYDVTDYGKYRLISIYGVGDYLLVSKGAKDPAITYEDGSSEVDITILHQPLERTYLVSTSAMDLVDRIDSLGMVRFSPLRADDWYLDHVRDAMGLGSMLYAGKYRMPDYELLLSEKCDLAIENTMIYHNPEVKEKLEELGIPVIVETSSYESDPLGRLEWIKLYGVLYDSEDAADKIFEEQVKIIASKTADAGKGKKIAFFYVTATGSIVVRAPGDYITKMIEMSGADYVPGKESVTASGSMGSVNMQAEDFYAVAKDADILIYNSTIDGEIGSADDLIAKNAIFADFTAVREGNVYCLSQGFFQKSTGVADFITDVCNAVSGSSEEYTFLTKLE